MSDKVLMPKALTAENGAKYALSGEFYEKIELPCDNCYLGTSPDDGENCAVCNGSGVHNYDVPISWTNIKRIYAAAVKALGEEVK